MKTSHIAISFLILLLSACSRFSSGENIVTPTVMPSATSTIPIATFTLSPTEIIIPASPTTSSPDETCESPAYTSRSEISPDGNWIAVTCREERDDVGSYLHVFNIHDKQNWRVYFRDYAGGFYFDRNDMLYPFHWSKDGQSLYIVHPTRLDGTIGLGPGGTTLLKIDLPTGQTYEVINEIANMIETPQISFSFSQDDKFLLYIPQTSNSYKINILNLATHKARVIELKGNNLYGAGFTLWSSDNNKVILLLKDENGIYSLVLLDLVTSLQTALVNNMQNELYPVEWKDENIVILSSNYYTPDGGEQWLLNIRNGEMTKLNK
ncbi:hypothetical protein [Candidatus Villigracilis affinis]|uniref:hypothetical protein n=1 Tax=Candidatus Villigracilis affinis TaxID=3140682 RepID=UPI002A2277D3|nr:hypothetical protein [Anaerolineales bacterium]